MNIFHESWSYRHEAVVAFRWKYISKQDDTKWSDWHMSIEDLLKDRNRHAYNAVIEEKEIKIPNAKQLFRLCYTYVVQRQALAIENMRGMDFYSDDRDDLRLIARHYEQKARAMITTVNMMDYYQGVRKKLGIDKLANELRKTAKDYEENLDLVNSFDE